MTSQAELNLLARFEQALINNRLTMAYQPKVAIEDGRLVPFLPAGAAITRRQDARAAYARDGTVYAVERQALAATRSLYGATCAALVLPADESMTLDTPEDWAAAERRLGAPAEHRP